MLQNYDIGLRAGTYLVILLGGGELISNNIQ